MAYSEKIAANIRHVLAGRGGIIEKKMFGGMAFLLRGKMLIGVQDEKVVARCRPEDQFKILKPPHVTPMDFTGRPMSGWLYVTGPTVKTTAGLKQWVAMGETALGLGKTVISR